MGPYEMLVIYLGMFCAFVFTEALRALIWAAVFGVVAASALRVAIRWLDR